MARNRHTAEQIVSKLREAEVHLSKGLSIALKCTQIGITNQTYYRWRPRNGGRAEQLVNRDVFSDTCRAFATTRMR